MLNHEYYLWVEIEANKRRILDYSSFCQILDKCYRSGIGSLILGVKDITGFGIYQSDLVPHYSKYSTDFDNSDYLQKYIRPAHERGLKIYAAVDVFAEGLIRHPHPLAPGYKNPEWATRMYGIDPAGAPVIKPITDLSGIRTTGSIDDFGDVFVNPVREDVRDYELGIIRELANQYEIDGVVLDRVRFVGLGSDFSDYSRTEFEKFIGRNLNNWPEEVYRLVDRNGAVEVEYGPLFGDWTTFRAQIIKEFIIAARKITREAGRKVEFIDYTGSWYPLYYQVGRTGPVRVISRKNTPGSVKNTRLQDMRSISISCFPAFIIPMLPSVMRFATENRPIGTVSKGRASWQKKLWVKRRRLSVASMLSSM